MGGGLMQLVAYGAQDIYLTGNPQITFFKVVYRRHTNFSMEAIEQTLNGTVDYGNRVSATISRNGDLVGRMYYEVDITGIDDGNPSDDIFANLGSALIKEVECEVGGQRIDKHYGHWMEVWSELTEPNTDGVMGQIPIGLDLKGGTKFQNMSYMGGVQGRAVAGTDEITAATSIKAFVPLQFWFCRNPGLALPLIALQYHEVKIVTEFQKQELLIQADDVATAASTTLAVKLYADYIYLDTDERRRFAQVSHEYLIEQLQFEDKSESKSHELNFNHPVKELIWTGGVTDEAADLQTSAGAGSSTPKTLNAADQTFQLKLNGHDRFAERDYRYFTRAQVWQHHTGFGGIGNGGQATGLNQGKCDDSIAVYSFALKPEEHQPSGTCNFSRIDNAQLVCGVAKQLYVYAVNYNVLRIMSGMGGLAYSN